MHDPAPPPMPGGQPAPTGAAAEPVLVGAAVDGVLTAGTALAIGTEVVTPEVGALILAFLIAVQVLVSTVVRRKVTPV